MKPKKNGRVEFLRFIFALAILFFHIHKRFAGDDFVELGSTGFNFFARGYIGVEFFFLVSGYLLASAAYAKREQSTEFIGTETALVMKKKFWNIFPYHLFAIILTIIVNAYFLEETMLDRFHYLVDSWASIFFLQVFGFDSNWVNKLTWYVDVWLMVTFIFYPLLRKHYEVFVKIICPLLALFILGYMNHEYDGIAGVDGWTGMFYKCFLRGLSEMALGCCTYSLTRQFNKYKFTNAGKKILGIVELICYLIAFNFACTEMDVNYGYPVIFVLWIAVTLSFLDVNPWGEFFNKPIFYQLGKASLMIYLNQFYAIRLVQELLPDVSFEMKALLCTLVTFAGALACYYVVGWFNKHKPFSRLIIEKKGE
ncbi:Peptidoglycan/LPS O-acetylase OafA/YrhL, contains acyltransferase and SGNH-hydrolase domains [Pseudobutyrivibrio sp. YE44]|uniref:acyltransferase family protein n=1 Tax=Pseudobutyrivibrio sp. YE44 TaxID=1520802 RepID=UPI0008908F51|nr:acyltransferase [Pseudobutyrivibrio sp. YE44]SDB31296.1 Peptidoglycan/LPS O-acetylase OafA/YrhL, contains acyltransferase and SGNH-hydrolase domains [Pseudobutyrivibrio sp. YE44]